MARRTRDYIKTLFQTGDMPTQADFVDMLDSTVFYGDDIVGITQVTYGQLVSLKKNSMLTPGALYAITDYKATSSLPGVISANHYFVLIVKAVSTNELDVRANARRLSSDSYFEGQNLGAWQIWYSLDNDKSRFEWADTSENGRGVIYRMVDEYENDLPYDFKGLKMQRLKSDIGEYDELNSADGYYYTFSSSDGLTDRSLNLSPVNNIHHNTIQCPGKQAGSNNKREFTNAVIITDNHSVKDNHFLRVWTMTWLIPPGGPNNCYSNQMGQISKSVIRGCLENNTLENLYTSTIDSLEISANQFGLIADSTLKSDISLSYNSFGKLLNSKIIATNVIERNKIQLLNTFTIQAIASGVSNSGQVSGNIIEYLSIGTIESPVLVNNHFGYCANITLTAGTDITYNNFQYALNDIQIVSGGSIQGFEIKSYVTHITISNRGVGHNLGYITIGEGCQYLSIAVEATILMNIEIAKRVRGTANNYLDLTSIVTLGNQSTQHIVVNSSQKVASYYDYQLVEE